MRKISILLIVFALALGACSGAAETATQPAESPAATTAPETPTEAAQAAPTEAPTAAVEAPAGGPVTYQIVPGESTVTYEVGETFFNQNNRFNLAVGVTSQVAGDIQLDAANPQAAQVGPIAIDISQFQSDSSRRDGRIRQEWLESATYPTATFTPTSIDGLPATYTEGQPISFTMTGDLTVKQTTKPVTFEVTAILQAGTLTGTATTTILLSDFAVGPIEIAGMLGTEDEAKLTLAFVARP
jgi:polyisoprenoid-binding protein YceI